MVTQQKSFFYKNIKTEGSLRMFLVFSVLSLKMFLTCFFFQILIFHGKFLTKVFKMKTISFAKPLYVLSMFLLFLPLKPYILCSYIKKRVLNYLIGQKNIGLIKYFFKFRIKNGENYIISYGLLQ